MEVAIFACSKGCKHKDANCAYRKMYDQYKHKFRIIIDEPEDYDTYWDTYNQAINSKTITTIKCFNCKGKSNNAVKTLDVTKLLFHQEGEAHERNVNCAIIAASGYDPTGFGFA